MDYFVSRCGINKMLILTQIRKDPFLNPVNQRIMHCDREHCQNYMLLIKEEKAQISEPAEPKKCKKNSSKDLIKILAKENKNSFCRGIVSIDINCSILAAEVERLNERGRSWIKLKKMLIDKSTLMEGRICYQEIQECHSPKWNNPFFKSEFSCVQCICCSYTLRS